MTYTELHDAGKLDLYYFHPDHLGSSSYITNATGKVSQHMEYLPFGETLADEHSNSHNSPFKYNGKEFDEETGNYYYSARYYDPKWSIFISVDPLAEKTMDAYGYCYQNPINLVDPSGMNAEGWIEQEKDGVTSYTYDPNIDNIDQAKSKYDNVSGFSKSYDVWNNDYGYSYNLNADGTVTNGAGQIMDNRFDINTLGGSSIKATNPLGFIGLHNFNVGLTLTGMETGVGGTRIGSNAKLYVPGAFGKVFYGNQYVKTYGLSTMAKGLGVGSAAVGTALDMYGVYNYYQNPNDPNSTSPGKAAINAGMTAYGLFGGGYGLGISLLYGGFEAFHPGGFNGAMERSARVQESVDRIMNPPGQVTRFYIMPWGAQKL